VSGERSAGRIARDNAKLTSSLVFLVLCGQRMSGIESRDLECMAHLVWVYNDKVFVRRLSVGFVDDLGDGFAHDNENDWWEMRWQVRRKRWGIGWASLKVTRIDDVSPREQPPLPRARPATLPALTHGTMAGGNRTTSTKDPFHLTFDRNPRLARPSSFRTCPEFPRRQRTVNPSWHRL